MRNNKRDFWVNDKGSLQSVKPPVQQHAPNKRANIPKTLTIKTKKLTTVINRRFNNLNQTLQHRIPLMRKLWFRSTAFAVAGLLILSSISLVIVDRINQNRYTLNNQVTSLVGKSTVDTKLITETDKAISYNRANEDSPKDIQKVLQIAANKQDATGKKPYNASFAKDPSGGITFGDTEGERSFTIVPQFGTTTPRKDTEGRVVYPSGASEKHIYSFKTNGIKSDIILTQAPKQNTKTYTYKLNLGTGLEAKMLPDGGVGIYSADPNLFNNLQVGDQKSQALVDKARTNAQKNTLVFELPKPFITNQNNTKNYEDVNYKLNTSNNTPTLILEARNLKQQTYPLSIDPTIIVTTTSDFSQNTGNTGNIDSSTADQINRGTIGSGAVGTTTQQTNAFTSARYGHSSVAYNGYLYIVGGYTGSNQNDIQYCPLNTNGSVGTCTQQTNAFTFARRFHASVVNNGYLYIIGGLSTMGDQNDIQYCPINSNGSVGTCTRQTAAYTTIRAGHSSVVYNGYLYIIGGLDFLTHLDDIQYCPINSNGSVGACTQQTSAFTGAREYHTSIVYNGYLYIIGGKGLSYYNDIQYCPINSNGSVGTCTQQTSAFTTARYGHTSIVYNGYLYVIGGDTGSNQNDIQYCPINSNGSVGTCTRQTNAFTGARYYHSSVVNNGYLYVIGGYSVAPENDVQRLPIGQGRASNWTATASFTTARYGHASVANNGYLYIIGGVHATSDTLCNGTASLYCSDVQYAAINANGTVGAWATTTSFTTARNAHTSVAYNGYLYVIGGNNGTNQSDVQYAFICDGTATGGCTAGSGNIGKVGTWATTTAFTTARRDHTSVAYNGYLYVIGGFDASRLSDVQYAFICDGTATGGCVAGAGNIGKVGTWATTTAFTTARNGHTSVAYNGYLYVIGGYTSSYQNDVQYAAINANGTVGTWATTTSFTTARNYHTSVAYNGYLYVIGGFNGGMFNDVQYAFICDGTATGGCTAGAGNIGKVGTWATTTSFTTARYSHTSVAYNGYLYVMGGYGGSYQNDVQYANIGPPDGRVGATTQQTAAFTTARYAHTSVAYNGYLYIIGGSGGGTRYNDIQYCPINSNGSIGTCTQQTNAFTTARSSHTSVAYNGYLYIIGGFGSGGLNDIQYCPLNTNGSVGTCIVQAAAFTTPRDGLTSVVYNSYLYIIGGSNDTPTYENDIQYCPINSNGSIGTCTQQTNAFTTARSYHTSVAYNGYLYVIGGADGTSQNDIQRLPALTPSFIARYERTIDTTASGNLINSFVINGTATCSYTVTYKTAGSSNIYGAATTLLNVYPGVSQTITSASTRYVLFSATLNDSSCGGQSTITSISLTYNGAPDSPTLILPSASATAVPILPEFRLGSTDETNDYLRYRIEVCSTSNCSSIVRTIDQTLSQTGWIGQSTQSATAYTGGLPLTQVAIHQYQTPALTASTQYWWRGYASDPGGSNQLSAASAISTFTTGVATPATVNIKGNVNIGGDVIIKP